MVSVNQVIDSASCSIEPENQWRHRVDFLRQVALFAGVDRARLFRIAQDMTLRSFGSGEMIFCEGDIGHHLYFIKSGQVRIFTHTPDGHETLVVPYGQPGEMFGELAVLDGLPRSATAVALGQALLYSLSGQNLYRQMQQCPQLALNCLNELCKRLRSNTRRVNSLTSLDIRQRLACTLLDLAQSSGPNDVGKRYITLPLTQDDLARLIGASRESVNKNLRDFCNRQWISLRYKQITLLDLEALRIQTIA